MRPIDADELKNAIVEEGQRSKRYKIGEFWELNREEIWKVIDEMPTVQPEIIQCKDCDWWTKQKDSVRGRCELMQMYPTGGWYCGNARRRPENETD